MITRILRGSDGSCEVVEGDAEPVAARDVSGDVAAAAPVWGGSEPDVRIEHREQPARRPGRLQRNLTVIASPRATGSRNPTRTCFDTPGGPPARPTRISVPTPASCTSCEAPPRPAPRAAPPGSAPSCARAATAGTSAVISPGTNLHNSYPPGTLRRRAKDPRSRARARPIGNT